jgi:hypothetical protein
MKEKVSFIIDEEYGCMEFEINDVGVGFLVKVPNGKEIFLSDTAVQHLQEKIQNREKEEN